jgi:hexosaminidase
MPAPAEVHAGSGRLAVTSELTVALRSHDDARLRAAVTRALERWQARTGLTFKHTPAGPFAFGDASAASTAPIVIDCAAGSAAIPTLGEDESYTLEVSATQAVLKAPTTVGAIRGLETLLQLLQFDAQGWFVRAVTVRDQPRFPWRGLLIDVCRHWQPIEVIKRNLDGMALVKLNVLHLHLTEDQGFRIESKTFPRLQEFGSDGHYFTQDQIREIIAYAADRGIRVVPEFDIPGHATSWVVGFPELASAPGPYVIERKWGVFDPVLDPTNEKTYELLDGFLGEMAALFPDPFIHIGGDENNGKQWNANTKIQAFIREHNLKNNEGLHAYFNQRVRDILQKHGKKLIGWDEILHPDLPKDSVIHSWRGAAGLANAANQGFTAILSNGYYIDLCYSAADHYRNDPIPANTTLTPEQQKRILGGEATMWAEWVTPETIDSRIWPRTAAIAERLWSPRDVNDVADMYRRLAIVSRRLEEAGLQHEKNRPSMIRRLAGDSATPELVQQLTALIDAIEPVKKYERGHQQPSATQQSPLTGIADCARPESDLARQFTDNVQAMLATPNGNPSAAGAVRTQLIAWRATGMYLVDHATEETPQLQAQAVPIAKALVSTCEVGADAFSKMTAIKQLPADWKTNAFATLTKDAKPHGPVELPMSRAIRLLVEAAAKANAEPPKP